MRVLLLFLLLVPWLAQAEEDRAIVLQATRNTRELGGLPLAGGTFREGMVYRSGALCFLTPGDVDRMKKLGLKTLIDLRNAPEIERDGPDRPGLTGAVPRFLSLPMHNSRGTGQEAYHYYIRENPRVFRTLYEHLARSDSYPVLFHCSAGKDRTGIVAAVLLEQLGADRKTILDDYLQSQRNSPRLVVQREWLGEVFDYLDECGGAERFLERCGVDAVTQAAVTRLLKKPTDS